MDAAVNPLGSFAAWLGEASFWAVGLLAILVFAAVFALLLALFPSADPLASRRQSLGLAPSSAADAKTASIMARRGPVTLWDRFSAIFLPRTDKALAMNATRLKLAGYRSLSAIATYHAVRTTLMVALPTLVFMLPIAIPGLLLRDSFPFILLAFLVGMIGPSYYLDKRIEQRQRVLRNALPDALDLLVVCTEAGLSLNAALVRVAQEIRDIHPEFAAEMGQVNAEIRAGLDRDQALRGLVDRTGLDDIKSLMVLLIQGLRFGSSIAETLRVYSEDFRDKRMQAAEEMAAKLGTKMIFPMILCFMPSFFIVAVGPAMMGLIKVLNQ